MYLHSEGSETGMYYLFLKYNQIFIIYKEASGKHACRTCKNIRL